MRKASEEKLHRGAASVTETEVDEWVGELVEDFPPLSIEQRNALAVLFKAQGSVEIVRAA